MKIAENLYEYWIDKYSYSSEKKRKQFKKLLKNKKVIKVNKTDYKTSKYYVYHSTTSIKLVCG